MAASRTPPASTGPFRRFAHAAPNLLWQMDFKGHIATTVGRCHPLTVLDDHSRYALALEACADEQGATVRARLVQVFRRYGLPKAMLVDNGPPWGDDGGQPYTRLGVWLMRLGVGIIHSRPRHPQTLGKEERFHRSLKAELLRWHHFPDLAACQAVCQEAFETWRRVYNGERPHEALDMATPASRYRISPWPFPETLPPIEYAPGDLVRRVQDKGVVHFKGHSLRLSRAFTGERVAFRATDRDGLYHIHFCAHRLAQVDLHQPMPMLETVTHVPEHP